MGKFKIKITQWWASENYVHIIYSTNGIFWHKIKNCEYDFSDEIYYMTPICISFDKCESLLQSFNCLDDIKKYEQEEKDRMIYCNNQIYKKRKQKQDELKSIYKRINNNLK